VRSYPLRANFLYTSFTATTAAGRGSRTSRASLPMHSYALFSRIAFSGA